MKIRDNLVWKISAFFSALYLALAIFSLGFIEFVCNSETIADPKAGFFLGPIVVAMQVIIFFALLIHNLKVTDKPKFLAKIYVFLKFIITNWLSTGCASILIYFLSNGKLVNSVIFGLNLFIGWFAIVLATLAGILALLAGFAYRIIISGKKLHWAWESHNKDKGVF